MKVAVPKERHPAERRVATSPDAVKRLKDMGLEVTVESGAGVEAGFTDEILAEAGARIADGYGETVGDADIVLRVRPPTASGESDSEISAMRADSTLIGLLAPHDARERLESYAKHGLTSFAMEFMPRITRAQSMDVLSSQANLSGYAAVVEAAHLFGRAFPMMVTAAGTIAPARVMVLGAGVAGLQAIATARRLGGLVSAMDVRPAAREQVESLGATFVEVDSEEKLTAETKGGYAREMSDAYRQRQSGKLHELLKRTDVVITTALIPGRPAPVLVSSAMVADMKPGSVIVDMAVEQGGNVEPSEAGQTVVRNGVSIIGNANLPSTVPADASMLYARNLVNFLGVLIDAENRQLKIDEEDEIVTSTLLTRGGRIVNPALLEKESS